MPNIGVIELLVFSPIALALIILPIVAIVFLLRDHRPGVETALWALLIIIAPLLGPIVYLVWRTTTTKSTGNQPHPQ